MFSCEYCEIFKNTYFEEHLQAAAFIATSKSSIQSNQPCDKTGEESSRDTLGMLVRQMTRMESSMASMSQSHTNKQTGTQNSGEANTIERGNISIYAPTNMELSGEVNQPSLEEREPCNTELKILESLGSSARVKSTENRCVGAALFRKPNQRNSESGMSWQGSSSKDARKRSHEDGHQIDVGIEIVKKIAYEKETAKENRPATVTNLAELLQKFHLTTMGSRSRRMIKPLKS